MDSYLIVNRGFKHGEESLKPGTPVDASSWLNKRSLLVAGYLRKPNTIEDWDVIQNALNRSKKTSRSYRRGEDVDGSGS